MLLAICFHGLCNFGLSVHCLENLNFPYVLYTTEFEKSFILINVCLTVCLNVGLSVSNACRRIFIPSSLKRVDRVYCNFFPYSIHAWEG